MVVDALWMQILAEAANIKDAHEVELHPDGCFRVIDFNQSKKGGLGKMNEVINKTNGKESLLKKEEKWI